MLLSYSRLRRSLMNPREPGKNFQLQSFTQSSFTTKHYYHCQMPIPSFSKLGQVSPSSSEISLRAAESTMKIQWPMSTYLHDLRHSHDSGECLAEVGQNMEIEHSSEGHIYVTVPCITKKSKSDWILDPSSHSHQRISNNVSQAVLRDWQPPHRRAQRKDRQAPRS